MFTSRGGVVRQTLPVPRPWYGGSTFFDTAFDPDETIEDVLLVTDEQEFEAFSILDDATAAATDEQVIDAYSFLDNSAVASDLQFVSLSVAVVQTEDAVLSDTLFAEYAVLLDNSATASEEVTQESIQIISEVLAATDERVQFATVVYTQADAALAADEAIQFHEATLEDTAAATEQLLSALTMLQIDTAAADELLFAGGTVSELATDSAVADDALFTQVSARATLEDEALATDLQFFVNAAAVSWVLNTETGAACWYSNFPFVDAVQVDDTVFAVGPEGLVTLDAELDGVDPISAGITYGFLEFGGYDRGGNPKPAEDRKRVDSLWVGYTSDGVLNATVETYGQGYAPFTYTMPARSAEQPRNGRITPGKGLSSRYWRVSIDNTDGCDFEVTSVAADIVATRRR